GGKVPNYDAQNIDAACQATIKAGLRPRIMGVASHANSNKDYKNQPLVLEDVAGQMEAGDERIVGVMIESNLAGGRQDLTEGHALTYGQSITDGCIDWDSSVAVLERLAAAVRNRRQASVQSANALIGSKP